MVVYTTEANIPTSPLSDLCKPYIVKSLGVMPFPSGEDSIILKATYFCFQTEDMTISTGEDIKITVDDDSITVFINKNCSPDGGWSKSFVEPITLDSPFSKAIDKVMSKISDLIQKNGSRWCRIGNYKGLNIKSPYIDRLKAFCDVNDSVRIPLRAKLLIKDCSETPEYNKTLSKIKNEPIPDVEVRKINHSVQDLQDVLSGKAVSKATKVKSDKPLTDRQKQNRLNKLLSNGIGSSSSKTQKKDPRVRKV